MRNKKLFWQKQSKDVHASCSTKGNRLITYCIAGNFRGRKLLQISHFVAICVSFLCEIWRCGVLWYGKNEQSAKVLPRKLYFSPIRESFLPRKFPAIRYYFVKEYSYFVVFLALSECLVGESQCLQRKRGARLDGAVEGEERQHKTWHLHSCIYSSVSDSVIRTDEV